MRTTFKRVLIACVMCALTLAGCTTQQVSKSPPPTPQPITPPIVPTVASPTSSTYSVPVSWNLYSAPARTINVWVGPSPSGLAVMAKVPPTATTTTIGGLKKNQTYYFTLSAIDTNGLETARSPIVTYNNKQGGAAPPAGSTAQ